MLRQQTLSADLEREALPVLCPTLASVKFKDTVVSNMPLSTAPKQMTTPFCGHDFSGQCDISIEALETS